MVKENRRTDDRTDDRKDSIISKFESRGVRRRRGTARKRQRQPSWKAGFLKE